MNDEKIYASRLRVEKVKNKNHTKPLNRSGQIRLIPYRPGASGKLNPVFIVLKPK